MAATEHRLNCPAAVAPLPRKSQPGATTLPLYSRQRCRDGLRALFEVARVRAWRRGPAALLASLRFIWNATSGHRLRPWRSEYLKWRIETYSGMHAEELTRARHDGFYVARKVEPAALPALDGSHGGMEETGDREQGIGQGKIVSGKLREKHARRDVKPEQGMEQPAGVSEGRGSGGGGGIVGGSCRWDAAGRRRNPTPRRRADALAGERASLAAGARCGARHAGGLRGESRPAGWGGGLRADGRRAVQHSGSGKRDEVGGAAALSAAIRFSQGRRCGGVRALARSEGAGAQSVLA